MANPFLNDDDDEGIDLIATPTAKQTDETPSAEEPTTEHLSSEAPKNSPKGISEGIARLAQRRTSVIQPPLKPTRNHQNDEVPNFEENPSEDDLITEDVSSDEPDLASEPQQKRRRRSGFVEADLPILHYLALAECATLNQINIVWQCYFPSKPETKNPKSGLSHRLRSLEELALIAASEAGPGGRKFYYLRAAGRAYVEKYYDMTLDDYTEVKAINVQTTRPDHKFLIAQTVAHLLAQTPGILPEGYVFEEDTDPQIVCEAGLRKQWGQFDADYRRENGKKMEGLEHMWNKGLCGYAKAELEADAELRDRFSVPFITNESRMLMINERTGMNKEGYSHEPDLVLLNAVNTKTGQVEPISYEIETTAKSNNELDRVLEIYRGSEEVRFGRVVYIAQSPSVRSRLWKRVAKVWKSDAEELCVKKGIKQAPEQVRELAIRLSGIVCLPPLNDAGQPYEGYRYY